MDELADLLSPGPDPGRDPAVRLGRAQVTAVTATTVTVNWSGGAGYVASYLAADVLAINDVVAVLYGGGSLLVLGKIR